jgi:hypothetical protein
VRIANLDDNNQNTQFGELNCLNSLICLHFLKNIPPQNAGFGRFWLHCSLTEGAGVDRETIRFLRLPRWVSLRVRPIPPHSLAAPSGIHETHGLHQNVSVSRDGAVC